MGVVDPLEPVDVEDRQRQRRAGGLGVADQPGQVRVERPPVGHLGQRVGQRVVLQLLGPAQQRLLVDPQPGRRRPAHPHRVLGPAVALVHLPIPAQRVGGPALGLGQPGQQERAVLGERRQRLRRGLVPVRREQVAGVFPLALGHQHHALGVQPASAQQRADRSGRDVPGLLERPAGVVGVAEPGQHQGPVGPHHRARQHPDLRVGQCEPQLLLGVQPAGPGLLVLTEVLQPHRPAEHRVADRLLPGTRRQPGRGGDRDRPLGGLHRQREQLLHRQPHAAVAQHQGQLPARLADRLHRGQREHDAGDGLVPVAVGGDPDGGVEARGGQRRHPRQQRADPLQLHPGAGQVLGVGQADRQRDAELEVLVGGQVRVGPQLGHGGAQVVDPALPGERPGGGDPLRPEVAACLKQTRLPLMLAVWTIGPRRPEPE